MQAQRTQRGLEGEIVAARRQGRPRVDEGGRILPGLEHQGAVQALGRLRGAEAQLGHGRVGGVGRQREGRDGGHGRELQPVPVAPRLDLGAEPRRPEGRVHVGDQVIGGEVGIGAGL